MPYGYKVGFVSGSRAESVSRGKSIIYKQRTGQIDMPYGSKGGFVSGCRGESVSRGKV